MQTELKIPEVLKGKTLESIEVCQYPVYGAGDEVVMKFSAGIDLRFTIPIGHDISDIQLEASNGWAWTQCEIEDS